MGKFQLHWNRINMSMILSIVIPIYKVEKYIEGCLGSILPQIKRDDIELILIDDGTPDNSALIAESMIKGSGNAHIYHQSNEGLSCARNNGLSKAKGDYVWFIDSDDSIAKNSIDGIIDSLKTEKPDLLQLNYQKIYEDGRNAVPYKTRYHNNMTGMEIIRKGNLPAPAQFTIYRRNFLLDNSLNFVPGILHEDSEFKPRATYLAQKVSFFSPIAYNYLQRESGSIMSSFKFRNAHDIVYGINSLINFSKQHIKQNDCVVGFRRIIGMNFNTIINGVKYMDEENKNKTINLLKTNLHIAHEMILSRRLKYVFEGIMFGLNIDIAVKLYSILK